MNCTGYRHPCRWIYLVPGVVGLLALLPARAEAQGPGPVIIPGLPGANLQSGVRPSLAAWPYTDLPGGKSCGTDRHHRTRTEAAEIAPPRPPCRTGSRGAGSRRATPCSTRGSISAPTSRSSTRG